MSEADRTVETAEATQPGELLTQVAPLLDACELGENDGAWLLCFEDGFVVMVEMDAYREFLVLTAELGVPPAGCEALVYKQLLQVAARWQDMQGIRMGLDPEDDCVLQIADVPLPNLSVETLKERLESFVATARYCRQVLAAQEDSSRSSQTFVRV